MQWKLIYLARRNPALAPEAFPQAWREHSALGRTCGNVGKRILRVAQCSRILDLDLPGLTRDYDGVDVMRLRNRQDAAAIWDDPETLAVMRPDEPRVFSTYVRNFTLVCSEHVLQDGPGGGIALFAFVRRRTGLGAAEFAEAWQHPPAPAVPSRTMPGACRIVHNLVVDPPPPGYDYDGIAEWWFDSRGALERAFRDGRARAPVPEACGGIIDQRSMVLVATRVTLTRP